MEDVREEFARDPKPALLVVGMRVEKDRQHVEIVFQRGILESLNLAGQACVLEALQQAAEYVSSVMARIGKFWGCKLTSYKGKSR